jgi:hypothetical protein
MAAEGQRFGRNPRRGRSQVTSQFDLIVEPDPPPTSRLLSSRSSLYPLCIQTRAGAFTNLPYCGKVVSAKWDVAVLKRQP